MLSNGQPVLKWRNNSQGQISEVGIKRFVCERGCVVLLNPLNHTVSTESTL